MSVIVANRLLMVNVSHIRGAKHCGRTFLPRDYFGILWIKG